MTIINILTNKYDINLTNYLIQSSTNQVRNSDKVVYTAHVLASKKDIGFTSLNKETALYRATGNQCSTNPVVWWLATRILLNHQEIVSYGLNM